MYSGPLGVVTIMVNVSISQTQGYRLETHPGSYL